MSTKHVYIAILGFIFFQCSLVIAAPVVVTVETVPEGASIYLMTSSTKEKGLYLGKGGDPIAIEERFLKGRSSLDLKVEMDGFHSVVHNLKVLAVTEGAVLPSDGPVRLPTEGSGLGPLVALASLALLVNLGLVKRRAQKAGLVPIADEVATPSGSLDPMIGREVCGFILDKVIDRGGMGAVYAATSADKKKTRAAVKVVDLTAHHDSNRERFFRELAVASKLHHPAIVQTWDYQLVEERFLCIAMEFLDGAPLNRVVMRGSRKPNEILELFTPIFEGLQYIHDKGIIHRDIKPQNIFVCPGEVCKLIDFGLASDEHQEGLTRTGMLVGTPKFMAPEQITDRENLCPKADQYALGLIIFEYTTGRAPYLVQDARALLMEHLSKDPTLAHQVNEDLTEAFALALARMYSRDPADRYPNITVALQALKESL